MFKEFKEFAVRGNVVDMAVGIIIGGAFGTIVTSFIEHVITPLLLNPALQKTGADKLEELTILGNVQYGMFLSAVMSFILIAFVLFLFIKGINLAKKKEEEAPVAPPAPSNEEKLLVEIRDLLKNK